MSPRYPVNDLEQYSLTHYYFICVLIFSFCNKRDFYILFELVLLGYVKHNVMQGDPLTFEERIIQAPLHSLP